MIPSPFRLPLRHSLNFFSSSRKIELSHFNLFVRQSEEPKGAVVVPKTVLMLASKRNSLKRKLRSIVTQVLKRKSRVEFVLVAKRKATKASYAELFDLLVQQL